MTTTDDFVLDVTRIRDEARQRMEKGPVTDTYGMDKDRVIAVLNDVIATEVVCWLRYTRHAIAATGIDRAQVSAEFTEHAKEELDHALRAAERVSQLGGDPDFDPASLARRAHTDYATPDDGDLRAMLENNLLAERIVISTYQEIIRWLGDQDPTTRRLMESILEEEEEHADDLVDLIGV
ncbi:ferritin-like domain-containing protein [Streptomyces sp. SBT349]|uniref:ferritin-like domain-containing protein n=1 Tax=Streptomyces sp. SBT349 TaxID=1580539 RepID=UPI00066B08E9|nr:ferritin-like domain-containing protein [Streptomyces sp. SBT349]